MKAIDRERLFKELDDREAALAEPIDVEQLERDGLLIRDGNWYRVLCSYGKLPMTVRERIADIEFDEQGLMVRFEE